MARFPVHFFPADSKFDFIGRRWWGFSFTLIAVIITVGLLATRGLNLGIDFTGGVLMEIVTEQPADLAKLRGVLDGQGLGEVSLQQFGDPRDVMIRLQASQGGDQNAVIGKVKGLLAAHVPGKIDYRAVDFVGPTLGKELLQGGMLALLATFGAIMLYVWFRFEWQYGVGAIAALVHDAVLTLGFYSLTRLDFGMPAIAALLTIIGYSVNDSVVIYDRIRENMRRFKKMPLGDLINLSVNETLSRTVMTVGATLMAVLALVLVGGETLFSFSAAMLFGICIGTFSSIYISAPVLIYLGLRPGAENREAAARP